MQKDKAKLLFDKYQLGKITRVTKIVSDQARRIWTICKDHFKIEERRVKLIR